MCVIIHTARKRLLKQMELQEAMRKNSSGFFIAELLDGGKRHCLRTMNALEAETFWNSIPDESEVVMHFRIPSRGGTTLNNVHGWEDSNILFCHNRTLYNLFPLMEEDHWQGTDSEYFFKRIFMQMYRQLGGRGSAYKDGKLCPILDHITRAICGDYNKFLFVMPDNQVLRYGDWEGDSVDRPGFHASNNSYQQHVRVENLFQKIRDWFVKK